MWEHCTFIPERFRPRRPVHRRGKAHCENGVCTWTRGDDNVKTEDDSTSTTKSTADIPQGECATFIPCGIFFTENNRELHNLPREINGVKR